MTTRQTEQHVGGGALLPFPPDFRFGVATAAHQVEGDNDNSDWWDFEQLPGRVIDGSRSGRACEHLRRFRDDLALVRDLHNDAYRFSVEWARVEPEPGRFDPAALAHYREVVEACRSLGLEPLVTLYHFTLPRWFAARGGWLAPGAVADFRRYARAVAGALGPLVRLWVTVNEPMVYLYQGYLRGVWPPARRSLPEAVRAGRALARAHVEAYRVLHESPGYRGEAPQVGLAQHLRVFDPARRGHRPDALAAAAQEAVFNWGFLDSLDRGRFYPPLGAGDAVPGWRPSLDYVGVNYYTRDRIRFAPARPGALFGLPERPAGAWLNDLGWEVHPAGLGRLLRETYRRYGRPLWVTENGIADATDAGRPAFIAAHLAEVARVLAEGVPVRGYCHWSLYDNFEWAEGFAARFGLYAVDFRTQRRALRQGGRVYAGIVRTRAVQAGPTDSPEAAKRRAGK
jgi:beta-glucosidase